MSLKTQAMPAEFSRTTAGDRIQSLATEYDLVRAASESFCAPLSPEDATPQSMTDASPVKWHLAHTTWFFETLVLEQAIPGYEPLQAEFRVLFNSYYHSIGEQGSRPQRGLITRPGMAEVYQYRAHVDRHMRDLFDDASRITDDLARAIAVGLNHEQQHQELMVTDFKHLLSHNPLRPAYHDATGDSETKLEPVSWHAFDEGLRWIGHDGEGFAYDSETPRHREFLDAFELASRPATNAEYLEFIGDGGYGQPLLWLSNGWASLQEQGWTAPLYWEPREDDWATFTLAGMQPIRPREPVTHLSYYEADAYARWAGARLPTEAEWETAATGTAIEGNFVESGRLHPAPAGGNTGLMQLFGDVWEWTRSPYVLYPGYSAPAGPLGEYNGKFACDQWVLRGGSCATPRSHMRASYRNFFPAGSRWQFSGVRLARDAK